MTAKAQLRAGAGRVANRLGLAAVTALSHRIQRIEEAAAENALLAVGLAQRIEEMERQLLDVAEETGPGDPGSA